MKKIIFTFVLFFISVFCFGQSFRTTEDFNVSYNTNIMARATYCISTEKVSITNTVNTANYIENVKYQYNNKTLTIKNTKINKSNTIDNAYIDVYDLGVAKRYFVYQKITVEDTSIYCLMLIVDTYDNNTGRITYINNVVR